MYIHVQGSKKEAETCRTAMHGLGSVGQAAGHERAPEQHSARMKFFQRKCHRSQPAFGKGSRIVGSELIFGRSRSKFVCRARSGGLSDGVDIYTTDVVWRSVVAL